MRLMTAQWQFLIIPSMSPLCAQHCDWQKCPSPALKLHLRANSAQQSPRWWCYAFPSICSLAWGRPANIITASTAPPLFLSNSPTVTRNAQPLHSAVPWPARWFVADECGGMICKHCCVFWWWMFASCLHSVTHLSPPAPPRSASALSLPISWCVIWGRAISQNRRQAGVPSA